MNYKSWPDEDLRRVLLTDPDDTLAICEAAERFAKQDDYDLDAVYEKGRQGGYDEGYGEGYGEGYDEGYGEGERKDDSR